MICKFLSWSAKRSHNVQIQAGCALLHGLISIFGIGGTMAIVMQLRKLKQRKPK